MKKLSLLISLSLLVCSFGLIGCNEKKESVAVDAPTGKTLLEYGGRSSTKIITKDGKVIYIDPYEGDYSEKADLILITHEHDDHNAIKKITQKDDTVVIRAKDALVDGTYKTFEEKGVKIESVAAANSNHKKSDSVGFIINVDDFVIYHAGDTSKIDEMSKLKDKKIDYALLPYDGEFNMGPDEMMECVKIIEPKFVIPIHGISQKPESITLENVKILAPKEKIELTK